MTSTLERIAALGLRIVRAFHAANVFWDRQVQAGGIPSIIAVLAVPTVIIIGSLLLLAAISNL